MPRTFEYYFTCPNCNHTFSSDYVTKIRITKQKRKDIQKLTLIVNQHKKLCPNCSSTKDWIYDRQGTF